MDATTRWETEALRAGPSERTTRPRPSTKRSTAEWVTLREAESATGIPVNTLRAWVRKGHLPSHLESDGDTPVRMVDLRAVRTHAVAVGRSTTPSPQSEQPGTTDDTDRSIAGQEPAAEAPSTPVGVPPSGETMIVPVDAWNKMLTQLGNLHEAGQQLAEARERAAKAETEAAFLRERLAELRDLRTGATEPHARPPSASEPDAEPDTESDPASADDEPAEPQTTSYWRYLTSGWRNRKRRRSS